MRIINSFEQWSRWSSILGFGFLSLILALAAINSDIPDMASSNIKYEEKIDTPLLSARRIPETIQADIASDFIAEDVNGFISSSPESTCIAVVRDDKELIEGHNLNLGLVPASNQKIITTYTALRILGPEHKFVTSVAAGSEIGPNGTVNSLYLIGGGDPFLATKEWWLQYEEIEGRSNTSLEKLADNVVDSGIKKINGGVIGDDSYFDDVRVGPWAQRLTEQNQAGPLSALNVNEGYIEWGEIQNLSARIPSESPTLNAAQVFSDLLIDRGVQIEGVSSEGTTPEDAVKITSISSPDLIEIVTHINSYSSNIGAELLLKEIAVQSGSIGSTDTGIDAVLNVLNAENLPIDGVVLNDGSGLSEDNRLTCNLLIELLTSEGPDSLLASSFSIGGVRGSLEPKFQESSAQGRVFAKTGTLRGTIALSGYVESAIEDDIDITFAYISNEAAISGRTISLQEPLVIDFSQYPEGPKLAELLPEPTIDIININSLESEEDKS